MIKRPKLPLIATISFLVGFLVLLIWFNSVRNVIAEYRIMSITRQAAINNDLLDNLLQAGQNLSFERGRTNVLLNNPESASAQNIEFIMQRRKAVAEFLEQTMHSEQFGLSDEAITLRYDYATLKNLRNDVDKALALPKTKRDPALICRWYDTVTQMLADIGTLALADTIEQTETIGQYTLLNRIKIYAFDFRTTVGTEATRTAEILSANRPMTPEETERLQNLRGQVTSIWKALSRETSLSENTGIKPAMHVVEREIFEIYRPIQNAVLDAIKNGRESPYELQKVLQASVPALDSIGKLLEAITTETRRQILEAQAQARFSFSASIIEAILSLSIGLFALALFITKLLIPLQKISTQLERLSAGNLEVTLEDAQSDRTDEISRTWTALQTFRESLIERQKLEARLRALGNLDGLTGIPNRRALDEALETEWRRERRSNETIGLAMIDVDFFKKYNDRYGHIAGDECLKKVASVLREGAQRAGDFAGRYGGEEFLAILPGLSTGEAVAWAERLRTAVEGACIPHEDSQTGCVTVSIGVSSLTPTATGTMLELIRLADEALYRAKANGRNRVEPAPAH